MAEFDMSQSSTTDLTNAVTDFSVTTASTDAHTEGQKESYWNFSNASRDLQYYKTLPEVYSTLNALKTWVTGKGVTSDSKTMIILEKITGWGEDSFQSICGNLIIQKKVFGDAFAEIIRNPKTGTLLNIKPLYTGDMRIVVGPNGIIKRYEQINRINPSKPHISQPNEILHLSNNRIANEIHGISVIGVLKTIIDAKHEALTDERKIRHRELALGVLELDTDNTTKRNALKLEYQNAVKNGEVLVLPKGVAEIKNNTNAPRDRIQWLQYLDNLFYQTIGVPKVIVTSEGFTEAGGKVGFMTFEPVYTSEQTELEADLWNQLAIRVKFNRPPSLTGLMKESEEKNTGQTGIQPNEVNVGLDRTE